VFPSLTETFGNVLLEALAAGLPTVSFRCAASALHVKDGVNGLHVERGDAGGFVAAVRRLAHDAGLRARLGAAARETALAVGWSPVVEVFEQALREVAAQDGSRRRAS
jgi:glycosyltransferase involved in cell wall biosynthesis